MSPKIIFEDKDLLIIDKPAGLVVTKSETAAAPTVEDWLKDHYDRLPERMGIVHRLDKETSGLLLVAKTPASLQILQKQFKQRKVKKEYLALVHGWVEKSGRIEGSIGRNPMKREKFMVTYDGKEAATEYEPMNRLQLSVVSLQTIFSEFNKIQMRKLKRMDYGKFTMLSCRPLTGRTHQIRVHLKYIGHPIVADDKYGGRKVYRLDKRWCPRMFLHAASLGFYHPVSGAWMEVESEVPEDLREALRVIQ